MVMSLAFLVRPQRNLGLQIDTLSTVLGRADLDLVACAGGLVEIA
jgi:hypothetical protein